MNKEKYEYAVHLWGGFFNYTNPYKDKHDLESKSYYFDTREEREKFLKEVEKHKKAAKSAYNLSCIATHLSEGIGVRNHTCLHRLVEYKGKQYHSKRQFDWIISARTAEYFMEYKWYPGFNDYVIENSLVNEEVDYKKVKILREWTTGTLIIKDYE